MWRGIFATILVSTATASGAQALVEGALFDSVAGYRLAHYRGVVGAAPEGVTRIDTDEARRLWQQGAIFIDVNPAPGAVRDPGTGRWSLTEAHQSIPGAHWFPESGRGVLSAGVDGWFLNGVRRLVKARAKRPVVIFCQADCWMSWNAALRLHRAGIGNIRWFADGLDGWRDAGVRVRPVRPE